MLINDQFFMQRALQLASLGQGNVAPNPMVGCVIVHDNKIIGEGFHQKYGQAHAEVNAVEAVKDKTLLAQATVYVTLEPCSHFGKTPPCVDLLLKHQVKKVVVCNLDSNPLVGGQGIAKLKNAGVEVQIGILEAQGRALNRRFFTFIEQKRPYIILKWATSSDGFMAKSNYEAVAISGALAKRHVHQWRSQEASIMAGTRTAKYDNPRLDTRYWTGNSPTRIVVDRALSLPDSLHIFDGNISTIRYSLLKNSTLPNNQTVQLSELSVQEIIKNLYQQKIQSVIVEGGTALLSSFIESNLWDEARVLTSSPKLKSGIIAPKLAQTPKQILNIGVDQLAVFKRV